MICSGAFIKKYGYWFVNAKKTKGSVLVNRAVRHTSHPDGSVEYENRIGNEF